MKSEKNTTGSRLAKRSFEKRQSSIRRYLYIGVGIAVLIFVYMISTIGLTKQPSNDHKSPSQAHSSSTNDAVGKDAFYDIGKASSKSSSSSSSSATSSSSSSAQAPEPQPDPEPQPSSSVESQPAAASSSVNETAPIEPAAQYAVLQPAGGQALYSWALSQGTTANQIYQLNPGITAANWSRYVGTSVRIR